MENNTQEIITSLDSEIIQAQEELSLVEDIVCRHIICPQCREENAIREERRKILMENIRVKSDLKQRLMNIDTE